jgi:cell division protein DivIC
MKNPLKPLQQRIVAFGLALKARTIDRIPPVWQKRLFNRYALVLAYVLVWMLFFDKYDVLSHGRLAARIHTLEAERRYYLLEIESLRKQQYILQNDVNEIERVAREAYYMKRPNEDLFIVEKRVEE